MLPPIRRAITALQLISAVNGFRNSVQVKQTELAVEGRRQKIIFLKNIGKGPIAMGLNQSSRFGSRFDHERGSVRFVMHGVAWIGQGIPFSIVKRPVSR